jgi:hypothetical protein
MGYSETEQTTGEDNTGKPGIKRIAQGNLPTALTVAGPDGSEPALRLFGRFYLRLPGQKARNIIPDHALLLTVGVEAIGH